ncbi:MAG: STAS domain-containing protein [Elusimicrobia bacterium]|nr:STAS domain-containing protein [Elusimicrobiota bacterium]
MEIRWTESSAVVTLALSGRLDALTSPQAEQALDRFLASPKSALVLDLGGLEYISSAGLRLLLLTGRKVAEKPGRLVLCCLQDAVKEVLEVSRLVSLFQVAATAEEAAALLG